MAPKNGLQGSLDLTMEAMLPSSPAPVVAKASPAIEPAQVTHEEKKVEPKQVSKSNNASSWRQRGLCFSESTMLRLKLESLKTGKSLSEVADDCLNRHLPNNRIAS